MNDTIKKGVVISDDGVYRYSLTHEWDDTKKRMLFIMLNPSTANATDDDPTIRRCIGRAIDEGYGSIEVVNLFAFRAMKPRDLHWAKDPVGPKNKHHVLSAIARANIIVAAWGVNVKLIEYSSHHMRSMLRDYSTWCLGTTKAGHPRHPLYVRKDQKLERFKL